MPGQELLPKPGLPKEDIPALGGNQEPGIERLLARRVPGFNAGQLLKGTGGLTALAPNAELAAMAPLVRGLPSDVPDLMLRAKIPELQERLDGLDEGSELLVRVRSFLSRFGFLSANGSDFTVVPWAEDPGPVWQSIARFARRAENGAPLPTEPAPADLLPRVRRRLNVIERRLFDRLWASTRRYMELREATSLIMSEETYLMRRSLLSLAAHLGRQGSLESPSDIFYLYHDELRDRLAGRIPDDAVRERIAHRKAEMERDAGIRVPETISGGSEAAGPIIPDGEDDLVGIGASPGRVHGTARIVIDPSRPGRPLGEDDILVVPFTDVGWTPLLPGVRGIVAETGGQLSHTSIIAREYGLPAVVSVKEATRLIREGEIIAIDGTLGRVYRHSRLRPGREGVAS